MTRNVSKFLLASACAFAFAAPAIASSFKVLHAFKGGTKDGRHSVSSLTMDADGNLYGTTANGGIGGRGTVFRIAADGTYSVLYSFQGGTDGAVPVAGVTIGPDGALYGTTLTGGGATKCHAEPGCGTVYRLSLDGQETILHAFKGGTDGGLPEGEVTFDNRGNLFGTTSDAVGRAGNGSVFRISFNGEMSVFHAFTGRKDGIRPTGNLVLDHEGNLYGTTAGGGSAEAGTVFKITPKGVETILYAFHGNGGSDTDGRGPNGEIAIDQIGNLYGTTHAGGAGDWGAIFQVSPSGQETVLHSFDPGFDGSGGSRPFGGVILDASGNLYGTTSGEGIDAFGNVYQLALNGTFTVLHGFGEPRGGTDPHASLLIDGLGNLYGTTTENGFLKGDCEEYQGCGTVFRLTP